MSKTRKTWRKVIYVRALKDYYSGKYNNIYASGSPQERYYQKEWLDAKRINDWVEGL